MAGVGDETHLGAVGLVDPVHQLIDGLGQGAQLLLGGRQVDAAVQMGGVDLVQLPGQTLDLPPGHVSGGVEPGRRCGQVLDGPQHLADGPAAPKQAGDEGQPLADQDDHPGPVQAGKDAGGVHRDGVGLAVVGHLHGVVAAEIPGAQAVHRLPADGGPGHHGVVVALGRAVQGGDGIVAGLHPGQGLLGRHTPPVDQLHHVGAAVFRVEGHAENGQRQQQQVHHDKDAQLPQKEADVQPQSQGGVPGGGDGVCRGRCLKFVVFSGHGGSPPVCPLPTLFVASRHLPLTGGFVRAGVFLLESKRTGKNVTCFLRSTPVWPPDSQRPQSCLHGGGSPVVCPPRGCAFYSGGPPAWTWWPCPPSGA